MHHTRRISILVFIVLLFSTSKVFAQTNLYPVRQEGKWGYINSSGELVIPPKFDMAFPFNQGKAMVMKEKVKLFIDMSGQVVLTIPANMNVHTRFSEGLVGFVSDLGGGFLNNKGVIAILDDFVEVKPYSEGYAVFRDRSSGLYGAIDKTGKMKILPQFTYLSDFDGEYAIFRLPDSHQYGMIDKSGKIFLINRYVMMTPPKDLIIGTWNGSTQITYMNLQKEKVFSQQVFTSTDLPSEFQLPLYSFSDGFVKYYDPFKNKYGFMNKKGEIEISPQFDDASDFKNGMIAIKQGSKWGYSNKKGALEIRAQYDEAGDFNSGIAAVYMGGSAKDFLEQDSNVKMGYINKKGELIWNYTR